MHDNEKITLEKIFPYHPAIGMFIAIPCFLFWGCIYYLLFGSNFRLGFIMIFTALCIGTGILIIKNISKNVMIWFNDEYMFIKIGNEKPKEYLKDKITGFYSYDYETEIPTLKTSIVKFKFILKDGQKIYLTDSEYRSRYDEKKGADLKKILKSAQKELHFTKLRKKNLQNTYWYSTQ
ncbi:hypothetical protein [Chryseobacterium arthrosphaerae]|uniref:hypothetical protein n=1 Tax=Chryseobacterium arthrosphaerae TaxID=651561 RepID=UPI000F50D571|nr:hypothetical protein [Chryseobacterium arthrosphaerae]